MSDKDLIAEALRWANGHPNRRSSELMRELADALAAVPDAATEAAIAEGDQCIDQAMKRVEALEAERDAALAAVERVRAVLSAWEMVQARNREYLESGNPGMIVPIDCTGGLRAALDGAPEPEGLPVEGEKP